MRKRMRLPNGFGQISEIKNKRLRNKFRAMVTIGWSDEGKPKRKTVGYYRTYNEAYTALVEYHKEPHEENSMTIGELYEKWSAVHYKKIQPQSLSVYRAAWKRCSSWSEKRVIDIRTVDVKELIEKDMPPTAQRNIKLLLTQMFDYAIEYDVIEKNYPRIATVNFQKNEVGHHIIYTENEIENLWEICDTPIATLVLIQCYTGFRPNELLEIKEENINTEDWIITGGSKTKAGKNRVVPVHPKIRDLVSKALPTNITYNQWYAALKSNYDMLNINSDHRPHDGRKTFVTRMKEAGANEYAIKRIVGHNISDLTEDVYTERSIEWLHEEVFKLV